jgi:hypothetical protein
VSAEIAHGCRDEPQAYLDEIFRSAVFLPPQTRRNLSSELPLFCCDVPP